jgi:cellulose synthase/poly-beta-1,6-N-acetylglucosamine synthase-like glycosyltransferase
MLEKLSEFPIPEITIYGITILLSIKALSDLVLLIAFSVKQKYAIKNEGIPVSIIICARNEAENLKNNLPVICEQTYSEYEVVVVNDASTDDTQKVLMNFDTKYRHFRYTHIPKDPKFDHNKKLALTIGVKSAQYDHIVLTDADCIPASKFWLKEMATRLISKKIVLGYGAYEKGNSILNRLIRFDTLMIARNYLSLAKIGLPYMGVGRNLAWHRSIYDKAKGFSSHYHLKSGDDDILVNQMARRKNTTVCMNPKGFTISKPETKFSNWFLQKRRHLTAGSKYRFLHKMILSIDALLKLLTWPVIILALIFANTYFPYIYILTGTFILWHLFAWKIIMKKLNEKGFLLLIPFFEVFLSILPIIILIKNFIQRKQSQWK